MPAFTIGGYFTKSIFINIKAFNSLKNKHIKTPKPPRSREVQESVCQNGWTALQPQFSEQTRGAGGPRAKGWRTLLTHETLSSWGSCLVLGMQAAGAALLPAPKQLCKNPKASFGGRGRVTDGNGKGLKQHSENRNRS